MSLAEMIRSILRALRFDPGTPAAAVLTAYRTALADGDYLAAARRKAEFAAYSKRARRAADAAPA